MNSQSVAGILGGVIAAIVLVVAIAYGPIGQFGKPAPDLLAQLASMMGAELGWSPARQQSEIDGVNRLYEIAA